MTQVYTRQTPVTKHEVDDKIFSELSCQLGEYDTSSLTADEKIKYEEAYPYSEEIYELEDKMAWIIKPTEIKKRDKNEQNVFHYDYSSLSSEDHKRYTELRNKFDLGEKEESELQKLDCKARKEKKSTPTTEDMARHLSSRTDSLPSAVSKFIDDAPIILPLLELLAKHSVILAIGNQATALSLDLPLQYKEQVVIDLEKNQCALYERERKIYAQQQYVRQLKEAEDSKTWKRTTDKEHFFAESDKTYARGRINALKIEILNTKRALEGAEQELEEIREPEENLEKRKQSLLKMIEEHSKNLVELKAEQAKLR